MRGVDKVGFIMSEDIDRLIEMENREILNSLRDDEAIYVHAYYHEHDGKEFMIGT